MLDSLASLVISTNGFTTAITLIVRAKTFNNRFSKTLHLFHYKQLLQCHSDFLQGFFKQSQKQSPGGVLQKNSQNSQENTCATVSFLIKLQGVSVNFEKFLRTPFLQNTSGGCFCRVDKIRINKAK